MPCALDPTWARGSPAGQAHTGAEGNTQERMTVRRRVELGRSQLRKAPTHVETWSLVRTGESEVKARKCSSLP